MSVSKPFRLVVSVVAVCALSLVAVAMLAMPAAFAGESTAPMELTVQAPQGPYTSQPDTYYEDFGSMYRMGDIWYDKTTHEQCYILREDGYAYPPGLSATMSNSFYMFEYGDGYVSYQPKRYEDVRRIGLYGYIVTYLAGGLGSHYNGSPNGFSGYMHVNNNDTPEERGRVTAVEISSAWADATVAGTEHGLNLISGKDWLNGCFNMKSAVGWEYVCSRWLQSTTRMFNGCASLKRLDLSPLDTRACVDMKDMFAGCSSLETLILGDNWSQAQINAGTGVTIGEGTRQSSETAGKATFPVEMVCTTASGQTVYAAGDVIPDGPGVYKATRTDIASGIARIVRPNSWVITRAQYADYKAGKLARPAGVSAKSVLVYEDVMAGNPGELTCAYTHAAIKPIPLLQVGGRRLIEGVDYTVTYRSNVNVGEGSVMLEGIGSYRGAVTLPFAIEDNAAYAYLFENGLLVIKQGFNTPNPGILDAASYDGVKRLLFFDDDTDVPGANVPWAPYKSAVRTVVFDTSFGACTPSTCAGWFDGCANLTEVRGLINLNLSAAKSMANMFRNCKALEALDASFLYTESISDMSGLFEGCSGLRTLTFTDDWTVAAAQKAGKAPTFPSACLRMKPKLARFAAGAQIPSFRAEYRLGDIPLQFVSQVTIDKDVYECTGKPVEPKLEVAMVNEKLVEGQDYEVGYSNNLYPGKARAVILGKGLFTGGLVVPFTIRSAVTKVGDRLTYKTKKATYILEVTKVKKKDGIVTAAATRIVSITVQSSSAKILTLPSECTIGGVKVTVTAVGSKLKGKFRNVTCIIIGPKVTKIGSRAFAKAPTVKKLKVRSARLTSVKNCLAGSNVSTVTTDVKLSNAKRLKYKKWFMKGAGKTGVRFFYMI